MPEYCLHYDSDFGRKCFSYGYLRANSLHLPPQTHHLHASQHYLHRCLASFLDASNLRFLLRTHHQRDMQGNLDGFLIQCHDASLRGG